MSDHDPYSDFMIWRPEHSASRLFALYVERVVRSARSCPRRTRCDDMRRIFVVRVRALGRFGQSAVAC